MRADTHLSRKHAADETFIGGDCPPSVAFILLSAGRDIVVKHLRGGRHHPRNFESTKAKTSRSWPFKAPRHAWLRQSVPLRCAVRDQVKAGLAARCQYTRSNDNAASETVRSEPIGGLHEYAGLFDRCPECLRWCRGDRRAFIDRPIGLPIIRPQRPIAAAQPDAELRGDEVGQHRLDLHAGAFVRRFQD